ncbi:MAG: N,N'-diacetylchitobiase precursor [Lentisphaerae bacterium ADurb.BinA184]|nr:MAG: N,N'-diacetylchitobiase precursor [Lentisphaerae bacterium ADurb.BinA184]
MSLPLLPQPRRVRVSAGQYRVPPSGVVEFDAADGRLRRAVEALAGELGPAARAWSVVGAGEGRAETPAVRLTVQPGVTPAQGYRLAVAPTGVSVEGADADGLFYGIATLRQLLRPGDAAPGAPPALPVCTIEDWPDFPCRGVMLDVSRDKVPTLDTLCALADDLAAWKVNHIQLYMEHTFAFRNHGEVWAEASPYTAEDIRRLDAFCQERFIELAPNFNSFGHFGRWLKHPRYRPLAECPDGFRTAGGEWRDEPSTLDPRNPAVLNLLTELYAELLPNFTSRRFHVGCDETWELGQGRSREACAREGLDAVFLGFLEQLHRLVRGHGREMHYWGDMVWNHFPDRLDRLSRESVMVDWGYYRAYPFFAAGAAMAWAEETNSDAAIADALDPHVFRDAAGTAGRAALALADTWQHVGRGITQAHWLDRILHGGLQQTLPAEITAESLAATAAHIEASLAALARSRMARPDAGLILDEFRNNARMALHACRLGQAIREGRQAMPAVRRGLEADMAAILDEHRRLWRARNREGGLADSARVFEQRLNAYRAATA